MITPWYITYVQLCRIAAKRGYSLTLHGSMVHDLDLLAIRNTKDADSPEDLIVALVRFSLAKVALKILRPPTKRPYGQSAYSLSIGHGNHRFDISVMPRKIKV
jgi:hypothetical protein